MKNKQIDPRGSRGDPPIASGSRGHPPWIFSDPWGDLPELKWWIEPLSGFSTTERVKGDATPLAVINPDGGTKNDKSKQLICKQNF